MYRNLGVGRYLIYLNICETFIAQLNWFFHIFINRAKIKNIMI